ncbi:MAG: sigma-E processing peptidase SpoIIGA [Acetobacter sp.]|nr:sigma-E processing peptidase SpoIIGA [Bacteroides sp.]MCM1340619.1 sigma-E processing peptidase SpoIIGA [Acetobacter sp.]MCM1433731.1 sigma-E processing peptidase SpoIIGA [Clostridiales bacterium]
MAIYVDVLFVINFFITYLLLLVTKILTKCTAKNFRLLLSSFAGGLYALVILADNLSILITVLGKLTVSALLVFIAFGFKRVTVFIKNLAVFYFSNMLFLGVILAIQLLFNSTGVAVNNGSIYFDISAFALLASAFFAYAVSVLVIKIYNKTIGKNEIYFLKVYKNNECFSLYAFADSGNKLREPFSDYPVIIVDNSKFSFETERIIPFNTVGGEGVLKAFKPDKIEISNGKEKIETDRVYIAFSNVDSKDYSAILNPKLINM